MLGNLGGKYGNWGFDVDVVMAICIFIFIGFFPRLGENLGRCLDGILRG